MQGKYTLTALESFACLADKCPRGCCFRFGVQLDHATHRKWQGLAETDPNRVWLLGAVSNVDVRGSNVVGIAKKQDSADCFFLQPDQLCAIHGRLGHEFLSATCRDYPRLQKTIGNLEIKHATLSCPEIARLVLFDDSAPVFRHVHHPEPASLKKSQSANEQVSSFLDHILTDLFSASSYPLNVRISYLARLVAEIITLSDSKQLSSQVLAKFTDKHQANLQGFAEAFSTGRFASRPVNGVHMWDLLRAGAQHFKLFQACGLDEHLPLMKLAGQAITDNGAKQLFYQELMAMRTSVSRQPRSYEKVFARYLQCRFMAQGFPLFRQQHPVASFLAAVLPFGITQMLIWIKASAGSPLTDQDIVDAIVRVEEILFHSDALLKTLEKNQFLLNVGGYFDWFLEVC